MTARAAPTRRRGGVLLPSILAAGGLAVLIGLGVWQLERKAWKEGLIAALSQRLEASPTALPARETWARLDAGEMEFRRVTFPVEFLHDQESLVYTSGSALRPDVAGPGYWVFTPARLAGGSLVMVNRGFVPDGRQDAKSRTEGQVGGIVDVVGALRWPEQRGAFTPADNPARSVWYVRDHLAMAAAKALDPIAPFYVDQEAPPAPGGLPRAGPLRASLPNNHLQYALTWFGLACGLLGVFSLWLVRWRRERVG